MANPMPLSYPFKLRPVHAEDQKRIAEDFGSYPSGLASANHWGFKVSATCTMKELDDVYNYPLDPRDVWVISPPKCGTTWTQEMVWLVANDLDYKRAESPLNLGRWNFIDVPVIADKQYLNKISLPADTEMIGMTGNPHRPSPKFVKTHLPLSMVSPYLLDVCKVIYVARNPKDVCVSYFYHNRLLKCHDFKGDFQCFMDYFMDECIVETPVIQHMIEAWNLRHHPNLHFLFFEDLKSDLSSEIIKVAQFMGKSFRQEEIDKLAKHLHFSNFKDNPAVNGERGKLEGTMYGNRGSFIRTGRVGDWRHHFTPEMNEKFDRWMIEKLRGTSLSPRLVCVKELDRSPEEKSY